MQIFCTRYHWHERLYILKTFQNKFLNVFCLGWLLLYLSFLLYFQKFLLALNFHVAGLPQYCGNIWHFQTYNVTRIFHFLLKGGLQRIRMGHSRIFRHTPKRISLKHFKRFWGKPLNLFAVTLEVYLFSWTNICVQYICSTQQKWCTTNNQTNKQTHKQTNKHKINKDGQSWWDWWISSTRELGP